MVISVLRDPPTLARRMIELQGGTNGNERLTVQTGALLFVMLAALGLTIVRIGQLMWAHLFIGLLLIGPVLLKLASTGYRFVRYYTHDAAYRAKGPPAAALRALAPGVVLSTVVVFATGVALLLIGPSSRGALLGIHKVSFFVWLALTGLHVLGHLIDLPRALRVREHGVGGAFAGGGGAGRAMGLAGMVVAGVVLAILYIPEFTPWLHVHRFGH
jgi:hypothetical protein